LREWWDARNKVNAGEQLKPVNDIVHKARSVTDVCDVIPTVKPLVFVLGQEGLVNDGSLHPREHGKLMLVVLFGSRKRRERGACSNGRSWIPGDGLRRAAESHACLPALHAAADQGLQDVILETDSQILVKALQSDMYDRARRGI